MNQVEREQSTASQSTQEILGKTITAIVNISLQEGIFADTWKVAIVHLLFKKAGLDLVAANYIGSAYSITHTIKFSFPQGSGAGAGPVFYSAYLSTMKDIVLTTIAIHGYAEIFKGRLKTRGGHHYQVA